MTDIDISSVQTFTASDLLKLAEHAIAHLLAGGQSYTFNGRQFTRAGLDELRAIRDSLNQEIEEAASPTGTMTALAEFGRQQ